MKGRQTSNRPSLAASSAAFSVVKWAGAAYLLWLGIGNAQNQFIIFLGIFFPLVINTIQGVKNVEPNLVRAARCLGASEWQLLRRVVLPLLKPALVAALVYSFVRSMTTVSAVIFLVTAQYELATTYIIGRVGNGDYGVALAYCTVLMVLMSVITWGIQKLVGQRQLGRRATVVTPA